MISLSYVVPNVLARSSDFLHSLNVHFIAPSYCKITLDLMLYHIPRLHCVFVTAFF